VIKDRSSISCLCGVVGVVVLGGVLWLMVYLEWVFGAYFGVVESGRVTIISGLQGSMGFPQVGGCKSHRIRSMVYLSCFLLYMSLYILMYLSHWLGG